MGLCARELTPGLVQRAVFATAESRSHARASVVLREVGGNTVSAKTIERVTTEVGQELAQLRDCAPSRRPRGLCPAEPAAAPVLAVVQCDGGRARTRRAGQGPGVHGPAWRETKNACLWTMTHRHFEQDPHPRLPECFRDPAHVAELAEMGLPEELAAPSRADAAAAGEASRRRQRPEWRPKRLVRTCLSSLANSRAFAGQMHREARRRRFHEAVHRAFLGDGLPWNWAIWKRHFRSSVPILDFVHVLSYLYGAAMARGVSAAQSWQCYLDWAQACWSGRVSEVIASLGEWLNAHGIGPKSKLGDEHPHKPVLEAYRYLSNNASRMDYPRYRQQGLPVTTALMESMVKEINQRVKGTEMFWNDPDGAEAILQVRAAALCDDDRLALYLTHRPGYPFVRRSSPRTIAA